MDWTRFGTDVLPALVGLLAVGYASWQVFQRREQFFKVVRGLVFVLSICALAALWISELAASTGSAALEDANTILGIVFVVFSIWLSTALVSIAALYPKLNSKKEFLAWLRAKPLNFITAWGAVGFAILLLWIPLAAYRREPLADTDLILLPVATYLLFSIAFDLAAPMLATRKGTLKRLTREGMINMLLLATAWIGIPSVEFALDVVPSMTTDFLELNPYSWLIVILFAIAARSIYSAGFLGIVVGPKIETLKRDGFRPFDIPRGVYVIYSSRPDSAFLLFSELCALPLRPDARIPSDKTSAKATLEFLIPNGLVMTREFPDKVRQTYSLEVTPIIWLTESPGERRIAPTSLTVLADTVTRFMEANPNSIVLLEGIEYLATHNDFRKVLKQLDLLNEATWISRARLLLAVDPKTFDEKDLALLERDRTVIIGAEGIEELKRESMVSESFE